MDWQAFEQTVLDDALAVEAGWYGAGETAVEGLPEPPQAMAPSTASAQTGLV